MSTGTGQARNEASRALFDGRAVPLDDEAAARLAANFMLLADRNVPELVDQLNHIEDEARAAGRPSPLARFHGR